MYLKIARNSTTLMEQNILVSFIITTYNLPPDRLEECIGSIMKLSLNPKEREIILVDDGSALPSISALSDRQDDILYLRQFKQGLSVARNHGLQVASGQYIQFVDGNDYLLQMGYEHCLDLVRYHNPDIVCFEQTDRSVKEVPHAFSAPISGSSFLHNNSNLNCSPNSYIFRKSTLREQRFTPGINHEDEEFTPLLFLKAENIISTDARAYFYRLEDIPSMPLQKNKQYNIEMLADTERVIFHLKEKSFFLSETERIALDRRIARLTAEYLYDTIQQTRSAKLLDETIAHLYGKGLFPISEKGFNRKYRLFCQALKSKVGRKVLVLTLPRKSR